MRARTERVTRSAWLHFLTRTHLDDFRNCVGRALLRELHLNDRFGHGQPPYLTREQDHLLRRETEFRFRRGHLGADRLAEALPLASALHAHSIARGDVPHVMEGAAAGDAQACEHDHHSETSPQAVATRVRSTLLLKQFSAMSAATATERALKRAASFNEALARRGVVYVARVRRAADRARLFARDDREWNRFRRTCGRKRCSTCSLSSGR